MATAKRLPSGSYRVQVYSHTDSTGRRHYESFTAPTKREAEMLAAEWANKKERQERFDLTVGEAITGYIRAKEGVLSPSTIRGYKTQLRNNYKEISHKPIRKLTSEDLQLFISSLSGSLTPKSVRNIYGLLSSALSLYLPDTTFKVTLPSKTNKRPVSPSDADIQALFEAATAPMKKCIALAAFGSLRRGEICALTFADLNGRVLTVDKDMVQAPDNSWIVKDMPKNSQSIRKVVLPDKVVELLGQGRPEERLVEYENPGSVGSGFWKLAKKKNLSIRFHDLRHYFASIGAVLNIPDTYLADFGGWQRGSSVMKAVYQNNITPMSDLYSNKMAEHFDGLL